MHAFHDDLKGQSPNEQQKYVEEALWKALASMPGAVLHRAKMQQLRALVSDKWQQQQIEDTLKYNQWNKPPQITSGALGYEGRWKLGFYPSSLFTTFKALTRKLRQFPVGTTFDYTDDYASSPADNTHVRARLARWLNLRGYTLTDARRS